MVATKVATAADVGLEPAIVTNRSLPRAWSKCGSIMLGEANARLNLAFFGDSIAPFSREMIDARLKVEYANGGFAGRFAGETGFGDDGNGTGATQITGDFTNSPNGVYFQLTAGGSKYFAVGNNSSTDPLFAAYPAVFTAPVNSTRVGIYYTRRPGGGVFKVQTTLKAVTNFLDVTGLTSIDTNGVLSVQYVEVTVPAADIGRLKIVHVSGGDCYVLGGLVGASQGVITHAWHAGGTSMTDQVNSPRFAELAALIPADVIMLAYLDSPGDTASNTGFTLTQLVDGIMNPFRTAFPATTVPASTATWAGKTALNAVKPHFVFFGGNKVESSTTDMDAYNAAIKANAVAHGDCYVDPLLVWGSWRSAYDMGVMGGGDSTGQSTHPNTFYEGAVATAFLKETRLIGGVLARTPAQLIADKLQVGPTAPGLSATTNRVKFSDGVTSISFAPMDRAGFGDGGMMIESTGGTFEAGMVLRSTATNGREYLITSQPGGGFLLRDQALGNFFAFNASKQLALAASISGSTVSLGPNGQLLSGLRHGVATLVAGVVTVADTKISANTRIVVTRNARGGTPGVSYEVLRTAATSFTITARDAADATATGDTSVIAYMIIEP